MYTGNDHTFAICAYGKSEYLSRCIRSLKRQTVRGRIILCAAQSNDFLEETAARCQLPLYIRGGEAEISDDWNFAMETADTPLVTLAHQDDLYEPAFLEKTLAALNTDEACAESERKAGNRDADQTRQKRPLIVFTDYYEIRNGRKANPKKSLNLTVKKAMLLPLRLPGMKESRVCRRMILSFGSPICCPSVTYVKENLPEQLFQKGFHVNLDWQAWEKISRLKGSFCYVSEALMGHRIHAGAATTKAIADRKTRTEEDLAMFEKFWPEPAARALNLLYKAAQKENL